VGKLQISVGTARPQPRSRAPQAPDLSPLGLNCKLQISVGTARPEPQASDLSGHCQTSTASSRSQWAQDGQICMIMDRVYTRLHLFVEFGCFGNMVGLSLAGKQAPAVALMSRADL